MHWCFFLFTMIVFVASAGMTHAQATAQPGVTQPTDAVAQVPTISISPQALSPAQSRTELRAGWYRWDPYQYQITKNEITRLTGLDVELLRAIFANMGYSLVFDEINWKQHQVDISNGVRDIAAGAFFSEERSQYAYYSETYRTERDVIYVRTANARIYDFKSLTQWINLLQSQNIRLGVVDGFFYGTEMMSFIEDPVNAARVVRVSTDDENFANLLNEKVDAIAIDELVGETLVWRYDWAQAVRQIGTPIFSGDIHVIFSKATTSPEMVASFNQSLKQLRESGGYSYIVKEYLLPVFCWA